METNKDQTPTEELSAAGYFWLAYIFFLMLAIEPIYTFLKGILQ